MPPPLQAAPKPSAVEGVDEDSEDGGGDGLDEYDRGDEGAGGPLDDEFEREYISLMQVGVDASQQSLGAGCAQSCTAMLRVM